MNSQTIKALRPLVRRMAVRINSNNERAASVELSLDRRRVATASRVGDEWSVYFADYRDESCITDEIARLVERYRGDAESIDIADLVRYMVSNSVERSRTESFVKRSVAKGLTAIITECGESIAVQKSVVPATLRDLATRGKRVVRMVGPNRPRFR